MAEQEQNTGTGEWVDIVNEENEVIAQASRQQMRAQCLRHRASYIVVHDGMGKILVQRRTETKDFFPGWLDATAGGVVQSGENVLDSARREAEEELGIAGVPFAEHGMFYFEEPNKCRVWGCAVQLRFPRSFCFARRRSRRSELDDARRDHCPL
ncbi:8-oxo-dGTP pyrophosphatase MutT (NUDIX family) [Ewingella americana]